MSKFYVLDVSTGASEARTLEDLSIYWEAFIALSGVVPDLVVMPPHLVDKIRRKMLNVAISTGDKRMLKRARDTKRFNYRGTRVFTPEQYREYKRKKFETDGRNTEFAMEVKREVESKGAGVYLEAVDAVKESLSGDVVGDNSGEE